MPSLAKIVVLFFVAGLFSACNSSSDQGSVLSTASNNSATIYRDDYGTPHVFADDNYGVYYGYGYAVATDRLFQMEMLRRTAEGKVSEVIGEKYLKLDTHIRTSYDHRAINQQLNTLAEKDLEVLQAYADGFNYRVTEVLRQTQELLPAEFVHYDFKPVYWTAYDVAMVFVGSIAHRYSDFNSELDNLSLYHNLAKRHGEKKAWQIFNASKWLLDGASPTTVNSDYESAKPDKVMPFPTYLNDIGVPRPTRRVAINNEGQFLGTTDSLTVAAYFNQRISEEGHSFSPEFTPASNFWSVGKGRVSDAASVFVNGPQFGFSLPSYVYGIGLHGGDFNVVGNTLLALPTLLFAHNGHIGWGSTAGLSDQVDVFVEVMHQEKDNFYLHKGQMQEFESWNEIINVKNADPVTVIARRSVHGMVQQLDKKQRVAYVRARAWEGAELASLMGWINLSKDKTLDAARESIASVATNINFYTMDLQGQLGYTHGGRYPIRKSGQDPRLPTLGTGEWDWQGWRSYSENPTVENGSQTSIANWNNRPSSDWISSDLWTYTWSRADRSHFIFDKIASKDTFTVSEIWDINKHISYIDVSAPFLFPYLFKAFTDEVSIDQLTAQGLALLKVWDQRWEVDKQGYFPAAPAIIDAWLNELLVAVFKDDIGDEYFYLYAAVNNPSGALGASMGTGPGVKIIIRNLDRLAENKTIDFNFFNDSDPSDVLQKSLVSALIKLRLEQGDDLTTWRLPAQPMQWKPYNFRGVPQALTAEQSGNNKVKVPSYMNRGSENNVLIVKEGSFTAYDVIPPGQSGFVKPGGERSENYSNQLELFSQYRYKTVYFSKEEIKKRASSVKLLTYNR
ncbi:penicillin acylase family protein [Dasania marina]|uniref:penicillin acylase family protein n=1 Tax=Dasania marina TaxID=471499 RepID=UPI0014615747|nr:penicillin acylase family protein [Dasania marina]